MSLAAMQKSSPFLFTATYMRPQGAPNLDICQRLCFCGPVFGLEGILHKGLAALVLSQVH